MLMYCCDITVVMVGWLGGGNGVFFIDGLGWVALGQEYLNVSGLGWVEGMMGWVGLGYENWTHGHVCPPPPKKSRFCHEANEYMSP